MQGRGSGDGRFDDRRLDELVAAIDNPAQRVAYFDALFRELVEGARVADNDEERERYGLQALVVSCALAAGRASLEVEELRRALLEQINAETTRGVNAVSEAMHELVPAPCETRFDELGAQMTALESALRERKQ